MDSSRRELVKLFGFAPAIGAAAVVGMAAPAISSKTIERVAEAFYDAWRENNGGYWANWADVSEHEKSFGRKVATAALQALSKEA